MPTSQECSPATTSTAEALARQAGAVEGLSDAWVSRFFEDSLSAIPSVRSGPRAYNPQSILLRADEVIEQRDLATLAQVRLMALVGKSLRHNNLGNYPGGEGDMPTASVGGPGLTLSGLLVNAADTGSRHRRVSQNTLALTTYLAPSALHRRAS
jgi:hypothetical protein